MKRFKMSRLEKEKHEKNMAGICEDLQNIVIENYTVGQKYKVHVTAINNPHSFYVQPIRCTYLDTLEKRGKPAESSSLFPGSTVVYRSQIYNKFVRGEIITQNKSYSQTFQIFAIDYGYMEVSVPIQHIFMPETSVNIPPLARHCRLSHCEPFNNTFTDEVTETMQQYIGNEVCVMLVKSINNSQLSVQLNNSAPNDIATLLAITHYTHFGCSNKTSVSRMKSIKPTESKFKLKSLEVNDVFNVYILKIKSLFPRTYCVATTDDFINHMQEINSFSSYCQDQVQVSNERFKVGVPVGYRESSHHYERAVIKSTLEPGSRALLYLIDKAETKEAMDFQLIEVTSLRFLETPGIAFQCTFEHSAEVAGKLPDNFDEGDTLWIKIKKIGDPNIVELLPITDQY